MPLKVYISPGTGVPGYSSNFPALVAQAFDEWQRASNGKIRWTRTSSPQNADILVKWTANERMHRGDTEAGRTDTMTRFDRSGREHILKATMSILTKLRGKPVPHAEIKKTLLHEIGHALGLNGHSSNSADIMYYAVSPRQQSTLNSRDAATINRLYTN